MGNLPLSDVVNVVVSTSAISAVRNGFNIGCIIGGSTIITPEIRTKVYSDLTGMSADGFLITDPEYIAANLYFSQNPRPSKVIVGRWDKTGTETAAGAVAACRNSNSDWYACYVCEAAKSDIVAVAAYIETATPTSVFFYTIPDADIKAGTAGNVFLTLQTAKYKRSLGMYSGTTDAAAGLMGYAMGANTGLNNSSYTLAYKSLVGVTVDNLTATEVSNIKNANGNVYINRGMSYNLFEQGVVASGIHFDEVLGLDMLTDDIQKSIFDVLISAPKIPLTDDGVTMLVNAINGPCSKARGQGFITPGIWKGAAILNLEAGDALSAGFAVLVEPVSTLTQADRDARKAPPIYVAVCLAGAIEFVIINIYVQR